MSGLSIVVVTWNTRGLTLACLDAAAKAGERFSEATGAGVELVLVDNGSTDGTARAVREDGRRVDVVPLPRNGGFAVGANAGWRRADGDIVLFLNTDARIDADSLIAAWRYLAENPRTAIVGPQLVHADGLLQNSAHAFPAVVDELVPSWLIDQIAPRRRPAKRTVGREPTLVDAVQGAAIFVRRGLLESFAGFCEDYFFYLEETDLCWRVRDVGHDVVLLPGTRVIHVAGSSSKHVDAAASRIEYHRSLYRFLSVRRGGATMRTAVVVRTLRGVVTVGALAVASAVSARARRRCRERWALLRWHLAGRPASAGIGAIRNGRIEAAG